MKKDLLFAGLIVAAFAAWVMAHTMLGLGLLRRPRRWRAPVSFVVPPLAPFWGWREGMRVRVAIWVVAAVVYAVAVLGGGR